MNNNVMSKEAIQLLNAASSDSDSASDLQFALAPPPAVQVRRKIRTKRKQHQRNGSRASSPANLSPTCSLVSVLKVASICFAIGGTLVLGWMVMMLQTEVQQLSEKLAKVPTSFDDDTILELKKSIKELAVNQTYYYDTVLNYSRSVEDFRTQLSTITSDVKGIKESLKEAPQMLNIGKELDSLKTSLATYGASISDLKLGLGELKDSSPLSPVLSESISALNTTMQAKIDFIMEDLHQHHGMITALQNTTEHLSNQSSSKLLERVDFIQTALAKVEEKQINTTETLSYAMRLIQQLNNATG